MANPILISSSGAGTLIDQNGQAIQGSEIYVYQAGTTTQVPVYADKACSILLAQPLVTGASPSGFAGSPGAIPGWVNGTQSVDLYDQTANVTTNVQLVYAPVVGALVPATASRRQECSVLMFGPAGVTAVDGSYTAGASTRAVGDGSGTTLGSVFSSLSAAQAVYPFATSLSQTVDYCAIQAALNYLFGSNPVGAGALVNSYATGGGGTVFLPRGWYVISTTLIQGGGCYLVGDGIGGDVFSDTDANMPWSGTVLQLANGANCDLLQSVNFTLLEAGGSGTYDAPIRLGFRSLVLDGNKANNTSGRCVAYYTDGFIADRFVIQNAAGDGLFTDSDHTAGYDHEALISNFRITDNVGDGLNFQGPHDSQIAQGFAARNGGAGIVEGVNGGNLTFTNVHAWGNGTFNWDMQCATASHVNCQCDGAAGTAGIRLSAKHVTWTGGNIYGTGAVGEVLVQVGNGDGVAYDVRGCRFDTQWTNLAVGSLPIAYADDGHLTTQFNRFEGPLVASTNNRFIAYGTLVSNAAQSANSASLTFTASTKLGNIPNAGNIHFGISGTAYTVAYTGLTNTGGVITLTGCTGGPAATLANGQRVFQTDSNGLLGAGTHGETWLLDPVDQANPGAFQIGGLGDGATSTVYDNREIVRFTGQVFIQQVMENSVGVSAGAVTFDASKGNFFICTLSANVTAASIINPSTSQIITLQMLQGGAGGFTYVWPSTCNFAGNTAPVASSAAGLSDIVTFRYNGTHWQELSRSIGVPY